MTLSSSAVPSSFFYILSKLNLKWNSFVIFLMVQIFICNIFFSKISKSLWHVIVLMILSESRNLWEFRESIVYKKFVQKLKKKKSKTKIYKKKKYKKILFSRKGNQKKFCIGRLETLLGGISVNYFPRVHHHSSTWSTLFLFQNLFN